MGRSGVSRATSVGSSSARPLSRDKLCIREPRRVSLASFRPLPRVIETYSACRSGLFAALFFLGGSSQVPLKSTSSWIRSLLAAQSERLFVEPVNVFASLNDSSAQIYGLLQRVQRRIPPGRRRDDFAPGASKGIVQEDPSEAVVLGDRPLEMLCCGRKLSIDERPPSFSKLALLRGQRVV